MTIVIIIFFIIQSCHSNWKIKFQGSFRSFSRTV